MKEYKGYLIRPSKASPMSLSIAVAGQGGKIPAVLDSLYTSAGLAMRAIDDYLDTKGKKNGKASSESTDQ